MSKTKTIPKEVEKTEERAPKKGPGFFGILIMTIVTWTFVIGTFAGSFYGIHYMLNVYNWPFFDLIKNYTLQVPSVTIQHFTTPAFTLQISSIPIFAVFLSLFFTWLSRTPVTQHGVLVGYRNDDPRSQQKSYAIGSFAARATAGHYNALESFPAFAVSIIIALLIKFDETILAKLSILYVASRVIFHIAYLVNFSVFRSISWIFGFSISLYLLFVSSIKIQ